MVLNRPAYLANGREDNPLVILFESAVYADKGPAFSEGSCRKIETKTPQTQKEIYRNEKRDRS